MSIWYNKKVTLRIWYPSLLFRLWSTC